MQDYQGRNRRQHDRYDTALEIKFHVNFDLKTKINFKLKDKAADAKQTYTAIGKNINVEGLCFSSSQKLKKGDQLIMDVFVPSSKQAIRMDGRVRWSETDKNKKGEFETGVKILTVKGEEVEHTIGVDPVHKIRWSIVLESVFGGFKDKILKDKKLI